MIKIDSSNEIKNHKNITNDYSPSFSGINIETDEAYKRVEVFINDELFKEYTFRKNDGI